MEQGLPENIQDESKLNDIETEDVNALKKALEEEKAKSAANLAGWQRAQADLANYRRRVEQEREEFSKSVGASLVLSILPVFDDLERAFNSMPQNLAEDPWVNGLKLVERKLRSTLESQGLAAIAAVGETFDPHFHEAVRQAPGKEGVVLAEMEKGYRFNDRVIRPSKVVVGNGENSD